MLELLVKFLIALPLVFVLSLLNAVPVWLLWNWVGPIVFHAPQLAFWHVWGLLLLIHLTTASLRTKVTTKG